MAYRFSNRASSLIVVAVATSSSTITLEAGGGNKLPILNAVNADVIQGTLIAATGVTEIVQVNSVVGDVLNVIRGQEGTSVTSFPVGSRFEVRLTTRVLDAFLQRSGGTMLGDINMNNHTLLNYRQPSAVLLDEIHTRVIRNPSVPLGVPGQAGEKFINFAGAGTKQPTISGYPLVDFSFLQNIVFDWYGDINNLPFYLLLCDGTNNTPDLRAVFIKSTNNDPTKGPIEGMFAGGGARTRVTTPDGNHDHTGVTGDVGMHAGLLPGHTIVVDSLPGQAGVGAPRITNVDVDHDGTAPLHGHSIKPSGTHQHAVDTQPPYLCMAKVIFRPPPYSF